MLPQERQYLMGLDTDNISSNSARTPDRAQEPFPSKKVRTARGKAAGRIAGIVGLAVAGGAGAAATLSSAGCEPVDDNGAPTLNVGDAHGGDAYSLNGGISAGKGEPPQKKTLAQQKFALLAEQMPFLLSVPSPVDLQKTTVNGWDVYFVTTTNGDVYYYSTASDAPNFNGEPVQIQVPLFGDRSPVSSGIIIKDGQPFLLVRTDDYIFLIGTLSISDGGTIQLQEGNFQSVFELIPTAPGIPGDSAIRIDQNSLGETIVYFLSNSRLYAWNTGTGEVREGSSFTQEDLILCGGELPGNPMADGEARTDGGVHNLTFTLNKGDRGCKLNVDSLLSDGTTNESNPNIAGFIADVENFIAVQMSVNNSYPLMDDEGHPVLDTHGDPVIVKIVVRDVSFAGLRLPADPTAGTMFFQLDHVRDDNRVVVSSSLETIAVADLDEYPDCADCVAEDEDAGDGGSRDDADAGGGDAQPATDEVSAPDEVHHPDEVSAPDETQPGPDEVSTPDETQPGPDEVSPGPDESTDEGVSPETTPDTTPTDPVLAMFELVGGKDCKVTRLDNGSTNTDTYRVQIKGQDCVVKIGNDATFAIETPDGVTGTFVCEGGKIRSVNGPICDGGPGKMSMERDGGDATVGGTNEFGTAILGGTGTKLFWEELEDGLVDAEITETNDAWVSIYVAGSDEEIRVPVTPGEGFRINMKALNQGAAAVDTGEIPPPPDDGGSGSCACSGVDGGLTDRATMNPTNLTAFAILLLLGAAMMKRNQRARALALYEAAAKLRHRSESHVGEVFADAWRNDMDRISGGMKASWEAVKGDVRTGLARIFGGV